MLALAGASEPESPLPVSIKTTAVLAGKDRSEQVNGHINLNYYRGGWKMS